MSIFNDFGINAIPSQQTQIQTYNLNKERNAFAEYVKESYNKLPNNDAKDVSQADNVKIT